MITVLIADDEDLARYTLRKMISALLPDIVVTGEAVNGGEAVDKALGSGADIVLLDIRMPVLDGLEAAARIRERLPSTRIVITSAHDDFTYAQRALNAGVSGYLLKPIREEDFLSVMSPLIRTFASTGDGDPRPGRGAPGRAVRTVPGGGTDRFSMAAGEAQDAVFRAIRTGDAAAAGAYASALFARWKSETPSLPALKERVLEFALRFRRELGCSPARKDGSGDVAEDGLAGGTALRVVNAAESSADLLSWILSVVGRYAAEAEAGGEDIVHRVESYLSISDLGRVTLESTADALRLSPPYLSRMFKAASGQRFVDYLTNLRMTAAKRILETQDASVEEIGRSLGYSDPGYFSRIFKVAIGLTPSVYRRMRGRGE